MLQRDVPAVGTTQPSADLAPLIQFYSIELAPLADGRLYVGVVATICEREGELDRMEMGSGQVDDLDKAMTMIRDAVAWRN